MAAAGVATFRLPRGFPAIKLKGFTPEKDSRGAAFSGPGAELVLEQGVSSGQQERQAQPWLPAASVSPAEILGL